MVNPAAGRRPVDVDRLKAVLEDVGLEAPVEVIEGREEMADAVVDVARSGRRPAVVGGDGTANLAVNALLNSKLGDLPPLAVLPGGSGCDLLRTFGVGPDLTLGVRRLKEGGPYRTDVGLLEGGWGDRWFINVAQVGVGAAAAQTAQAFPRWLGTLRYSAAFALRLPAFPITRVVVEGGRRTEREAVAVILANGQFFAGGWNVAPRAMLVDGELDVQIISVRKRQAPMLVPKVMKGLHLGHPGVTRRSMGKFAIHTEVPWPVEADGDFLGTTPVEVTVRRGAIDLWV